MGLAHQDKKMEAPTSGLGSEITPQLLKIHLSHLNKSSHILAGDVHVNYHRLTEPTSSNDTDLHVVLYGKT